jgi:predicted GNAT family acetyltransferase
MAGYAGPTPNGIRIGAVYTPPAQRKNGYASALTARLSQHLLDEGYGFCFLFADLLNPTSNHIYQKIGYKPVCDSDRYLFV